MSIEPTKVATGVIEGLRAQPLMLALVVLVTLMLAATFWSIQKTRDLQHELTKINLEQLSKAQDKLAECVRPEQLERMIRLIIEQNKRGDLQPTNEWQGDELSRRAEQMFGLKHGG